MLQSIISQQFEPDVHKNPVGIFPQMPPYPYLLTTLKPINMSNVVLVTGSAEYFTLHRWTILKSHRLSVYLKVLYKLLCFMVYINKTTKVID